MGGASAGQFFRFSIALQQRRQQQQQQSILWAKLSPCQYYSATLLITITKMLDSRLEVQPFPRTRNQWY